MKSIQLSEVDEIVEFIYSNGYYTTIPKEELTKVIAKHVAYGTAMTIRDKNDKIAAVGRGNWINGGTAQILDVITRKDFRGYSFIKQLIAFFVFKNPNCKYIVYNRETKYPGKKPRIYKVTELLKRRR